jgi:hypothetical protein
MFTGKNKAIVFVCLAVLSFVVPSLAQKNEGGNRRAAA